MFLSSYAWLFLFFLSGMPHNFVYAAFDTSPHRETERNTEMDTEEELETKGWMARLASLPVGAPDSDLCMSFWYHFTEKHTGTLNIKQKTEREDEEGKKEEKEHLVRSINRNMKSRWREGRVLIPRADTPYQVWMPNTLIWKYINMTVIKHDYVFTGDFWGSCRIWVYLTGWYKDTGWIGSRRVQGYVNTPFWYWPFPLGSDILVVTRPPCISIKSMCLSNISHITRNSHHLHFES